jgi:IS30 family transposase
MISLQTKHDTEDNHTMDYTNNNTQSRKNKHLNYEERMRIQIRLNDGFTPYKIAKELGRPINTVLNEIKRGTVTQIQQGKEVKTYFADTGEAVYKKNRTNSCGHYKRLECSEFIDYAVDKIKNNSWSPDACFGHVLQTNQFERSEMVCTKTLYNYIDLGLLPIKNADLPLKLSRNTKPKRVRKHKKKLGKSIEERPKDIDKREDFGHWEIDTVIGEKSGNDCVLLTLVERKTRNAIVRKIAGKTSKAVIEELKRVIHIFGNQFSKVFKTIT